MVLLYEALIGILIVGSSAAPIADSVPSNADLSHCKYSILASICILCFYLYWITVLSNIIQILNRVFNILIW